LAFGLLAQAPAYSTTVITVGDDPCDYGTLQSALDAAYTHANNDPGDPVEVWLTRYNITFYDESGYLHVPPGADITLRGGYSDCEGTFDGVHTPIDGHNGYSSATGPVLGITVDSGGAARLGALDLGSGINDFGGGIQFYGDGVLEISDTLINNNTAVNSGGGIYANGPHPIISLYGNVHIRQNQGGTFGGGVAVAGGGALYVTASDISNNTAIYGGGIQFNVSANSTLSLGSDTTVLYNTGLLGGGGVDLWGPATLYAVSPRTLIGYNHAPGSGASNNGNGGGIELYGQASAVIGSSGYPGFGVLYGNDAAYGGGIAIIAAADTTSATATRVFTTDPAYPVLISNNVAAYAGGAIYVKNWSIPAPRLCLADFRINGNSAVSGAAIYAEGADAESDAAIVSLNYNAADSAFCGSELGVLGAQHCADGVACNEISGNVSQQPDSTPTFGSVVYGRYAHLDADRLVMRGNTGGELIRTEDSHANLYDCLFADNAMHGAALLDQALSGYLTVVDCTIANNALDSGLPAIYADSQIGLYRSIIAQPGRLTLGTSGAGTTRIGEYVLSNDISTLPGFAGSTQGTPLFADAAAGNYRLLATSPGVDYAPVVGGLDLDRQPRDVDLSAILDAFGPRDIGAYERQEAFACDTATDALFCDTFER
jgi:predicted outer membrane repeat protein